MAITQAMCTSFKTELLEGKHDFTNGQDTYKLALFTSAATLDATTTDYSTTNEVTGTGYSAGGGTLVNVTPTSSGTTAFTDFNDLTFSASTITANGAMIYNTQTGGGSGTSDAVVFLAFGSDLTSSNGDFYIEFPSADASYAIIRRA